MIGENPKSGSLFSSQLFISCSKRKIFATDSRLSYPPRRASSPYPPVKGMRPGLIRGVDLNIKVSRHVRPMAYDAETLFDKPIPNSISVYSSFAFPLVPWTSSIFTASSFWHAVGVRKLSSLKPGTSSTLILRYGFHLFRTKC
jgi:hypothetical protein